MNRHADALGRWSKIVLAASAGAWALNVAFNNLIDYSSNFEYLRHVVSMDTTFGGNERSWRAITTPWVQHALYWVIMGWEFAVGGLTCVGALKMARASRESSQYLAARSLAICGLGMGMILWILGFEVIAGEWFMMWQSSTWNAQEAAFRPAVCFGLILLILADDPRGMRHDGNGSA